MSSKPPVKRKLTGKTIVTILFLFTFVSGIGFVYISKFAVPPKVGTILLSREEVQWLDIRGASIPTLDSRYLINYAVTSVDGSDLLTITDKTITGLTFLNIEQDRNDVEVNYNKENGVIKITAKNLLKDEKFIVQAAFDSEPIHTFEGTNVPRTLVESNNATYGYNGRIRVTISPFKLNSIEGVKNLGIYTYFTPLATDRVIVSSQPTAESVAPAYEAIWKYGAGNTPEIGAHVANWNIIISTDTSQGDTLLSTWVEVRYAQPIHVLGDPTIADSMGNYYSGGGTVFVYQYEYVIKTS